MFFEVVEVQGAQGLGLGALAGADRVRQQRVHLGQVPPGFLRVALEFRGGREDPEQVPQEAHVAMAERAMDGHVVQLTRGKLVKIGLHGRTLPGAALVAYRRTALTAMVTMGRVKGPLAVSGRDARYPATSASSDDRSARAITRSRE
jgi:hypothetical protein